MMLLRIFIATLSFTCSPLWAFSCYYTLAKSNCWEKYSVTVDVIDTTKEKVVTSITIPAGQSWIRTSFSCKPKEILMYRASFSPAIWESEKGKTYTAKNYWFLPETVKPGDSAWNVNVCYPAGFAEVPMPPEATNKCTCNFEVIPEIPAKQI